MAALRAEEIGLAFGEAGQCPGRARRVGHGGAAGEVVARQALGEIGQQGAFSRFAVAEEMGATGDVEQQPGIAAEAAGTAGRRAFLGQGAAQRVDRHPGRIAIAPARDALDQAVVGLGLARGGDEIGHQGARIGQPHVGAQAGIAGMGIEGGEARTAVVPDDGGGSLSRPVLRRRTLSRARQPIRRELGEPQRDNAFHRSTPEAR